MARIKWSELEAIYAITQFKADGTGRLTITSQGLLDTLLLIEHDPDAAEDSNITLLNDGPQLELGQQIELQFHAPRTSLGRFAKDFGGLIAGPKARVEEPENYFVVEGRITGKTTPPHDLQIRYRSVLRFISLLKKAAAYLDAIQQELVFFRDGKISVSVDYDVDDLGKLQPADVDALVALFDEPIHLDQKLTILSETIVDRVAGLPASERFRHLIREVKDIGEHIVGGYRLFASSFTYSKIRRDVESAQADFISRIHKTFVDLQGQVLGIPIATIVVASQLKAAKACGVELWTNIAVVIGAWIFMLFLVASIVNQWLTLNAISSEFGRQRDRLTNDFAAVRPDFDDVFRALESRTFWHRFVFVVVGLVGVGGAIFATWVALRITEVDIGSCL